MNKRSSSVIDARSVVIAVVVLLLGVGIGFAGGYKYEHHSASKTAAKTTNTAAGTAAAKAKAKPKTTTTVSPAKHAELVNCLAGKGVKYPDAATANFNTPPAGVNTQTLSQALGACYVELLKTKG